MMHIDNFLSIIAKTLGSWLKQGEVRGKLVWGRKMGGPEGEAAVACFFASPQLTCVLTKLIANGLFAK